MLTSLALIFLVGLAMGAICQRLKLPRIIGMLITGIVLGPYVLDFLDSSILSISADLRKMALIIILLKAGLSLDLNDLKKVGRPAIMLSFVPASFEIMVYGLLGAIGVPVFAGWSGGFSVIVGYTGGFIYGFIVMALLCGLGAKFCSDKISGKVIAIVLGIAGLACDHLLGAIQYAIVANISIGKSILLVSVPYLVKDVISVVAAYLISIELVSRLAKTGCYAYKRA